VKETNMFNDVVLKRASDLEAQLPREIIAHKVSAEYHRHRNMVLGGCAVVLTTLVGTAVFTGLVSQFGLDGKGTTPKNPFSGPGIPWLYAAVLILSILAPVIAALHTFMHDAEDAATHLASVAGYSRVLSHLTIFLARYGESDPPPEKIDEALNEYDKITTDYDSVLGKSLTLTKRAYKSAEE
jgi:hypothetical protein